MSTELIALLDSVALLCFAMGAWRAVERPLPPLFWLLAGLTVWMFVLAYAAWDVAT